MQIMKKKVASSLKIYLCQNKSRIDVKLNSNMLIMIKNKNVKKLPDQCAGNILPYKLCEYALKISNCVSLLLWIHNILPY